ncbi:MAG: cofactor assembly of complex C subunit B, partial [Snowella sp.]
IAGLFYWNKEGRMEKISLKIAPSPMNKPETSRLISVTAHRDELSELKRSFSLDWITGAEH